MIKLGKLFKNLNTCKMKNTWKVMNKNILSFGNLEIKYFNHRSKIVLKLTYVIKFG